jgi:hypothetical protein
MRFYHPEILYGLLALLIPLVIHLFNFKRFKKVYFTNIQFLKEIQLQSKRHSQWRHWLVLAMRLLFFASLVFAFAGPYIPAADQNISKNAHHKVNIFVDNSFSMQARGEEGSLLEEARAVAREIAMAYKPTDEFRLLSNQQSLFALDFVNRDIFLEQLQNLDIQQSVLDFSLISNLLHNFSNISEPQSLYLISDFQKSQSQINQWKSDSINETYLIPLIAANQGNLFIDSVWIEAPLLQPKQAIQVFFDVQNQSDVDLVDLPLSLRINGKQKAVLTTSIPAMSHTQNAFLFNLDTAGFYSASIELQDYPVVYDDHFYFSLNIQQSIDILNIVSDKSNTDLKLYMSSDSLFKPVEMNEKQVDFSQFDHFASIILNGLENYPSGMTNELRKYVQNGGNLIIIPSIESPYEPLNQLLKTLSLPTIIGRDSVNRKMEKIDIQSNELKNIFDVDAKIQRQTNIDMPYFRQRFLSSPNSSSAITLIKDDATLPILIKNQIEAGNVYCFYTGFERRMSNFSTHAVFVPIMYNLLSQLQADRPLYYQLGQSEKTVFKLKTDLSENEIHLKPLNDSATFIPQSNIHDRKVFLSFEQKPQKEGIYQLLFNTSIHSLLAFNFDRKESYLSHYSYEEINQILKDKHLNNIKLIQNSQGNIDQLIAHRNDGTSLWKLFVIAALSFLIIELFLLRFRK